jgi:hypothetical protein
MNFDLTPQLPAIFDLAHIVLAGIAVILFFAFLLKTPKRIVVDTETVVAETVVTEPDGETTDDGDSEGPQSTEVADTEVVDTGDEKIDSMPVKASSPESALQLLSILQKEARLIDFVQEDIGAYTDEEVGAAARVVHEGSLKAINEYFTLSPIRTEDEESRITLAEGFNASEVRLTGNVVGAAPFTGTLIHRGWRVKEVKLPKLSTGHDTTIVAAAEVEL